MIQFASNLQGKTIKLTSGPIAISESLTVSGFDNSGLTVSGGEKPDLRRHIPSGASMTISGLTIAGGVAPIGSAILNEGGGTLSLFGDVLTGNEALGTAPAGTGEGGAVATTGAGTSLYVEQCVFSANEAIVRTGPRGARPEMM